MALIKYSPIVNDIRGSVGNATFQHSLAGSIIRTKPVSMVRNSQQAVNVRTVFPEVLFAWRSLSVAQQTNWKNFLTYSPDFMKKSPRTMISGYSLFVKYNTLRVLRGLSILTNITFSQATLINSVINILSDSVNLYMDITAPINPSVWYFQFQLSRGNNNIHSRDLHYLRIIDHVDLHPESYPFTTGYIKAWGFVPIANQWIGMRTTFFHATMPYVFSPSFQILQIQSY